MDEYWDNEDQWWGEGKCLVCKGHVETLDLYCSDVCSRISSMREGNDCHA